MITKPLRKGFCKYLKLSLLPLYWPLLLHPFSGFLTHSVTLAQSMTVLGPTGIVNIFQTSKIVQQELQKQNQKTGKGRQTNRQQAQTKLVSNHRQKLKNRTIKYKQLLYSGCTAMQHSERHTHTPWGPCALCHGGGCKRHCLESDEYSDCGDRTTQWRPDKGSNTRRKGTKNIVRKRSGQRREREDLRHRGCCRARKRGSWCEKHFTYFLIWLD